LLVSEHSLFLLDEVFNQYRGAGSGEGQLAVVPPPVMTASPTAVVGAKGAARDPWATFCASGEILSAAAAKDVAGSMSQRLREASQQLSQQLKRVSSAGLRCLLLLCGFGSHGFMCQAADFADLVASGALTADIAAEVERLRAQHADAVREKSAAESKNRRLAEKVAAMEAKKMDLRRQLAEERREANKAIADAQAAQAEAKVARAEGSLARQRAEELEARFNALRSRMDKAETSTRAEVERTHVQFVDTYRELGARTVDFEVSSQEVGLRFLEWLQEELLVLPTIVTCFMSFTSLVTCEGAMNALSHEGCSHYEVFDRADENFEREIFRVEDPMVKQLAGALFDRMWGPHGREAVRERSDRAIEKVKAKTSCGYMCGYVALLNVLLLQMAHSEDVEDLAGLDCALPEAAEVDPVPPTDAGEGPSATPALAVVGEDPAPAPAPTSEDAPKAVAEPAAEDLTAAAGPSQVAE
jgi:hypothetical protein